MAGIYTGAVWWGGDSVFSQYVTVLSFAVIHPLFHFSAKCVGATQKEGYRPLNSSDRMRLERLLSEMGMNRRLKLYRNNDARVNAAAFGFNTIGRRAEYSPQLRMRSWRASSVMKWGISPITTSSIRCFYSRWSRSVTAAFMVYFLFRLWYSG